MEEMKHITAIFISFFISILLICIFVSQKGDFIYDLFLK